MSEWNTVFLVFVAAMITAVATGLGALPFAFVERMSRKWLGISNAAAAGLMIAASVSLIIEAWGMGPIRTLAGVALGYVLIKLSHAFIERKPSPSLGELQGADAKKALLIVGIMTLHSFAEGIGVGVSFGGGEALGGFVSAAIALHNIPEGLAISLVLVPRGVSWPMAAWWSIFSSLPQPLMAVPAYLFVLWVAPFLPVGFGLAAGAMLWMTAAELVPEAREDTSDVVVIATIVAAILFMIGFQELVLR